MSYIEFEEFNDIIGEIKNHESFQKLKNVKHHGMSRYEHSLRVAYYSYLVTKRMRLDYKETTIAALLHDFFTDEVENLGQIKRLRRHPNCAVNNALKLVDLSDKQIDIIKTHMFPVTFTPPKYLESWIVDLVDDVAAIYEGSLNLKKKYKTAVAFLYVLFFIKFK